MEEILAKEGFVKELRTWSFSPKLKSDYVWVKDISTESILVDKTLIDCNDDTINVGVLINKKYNSCQIYCCTCVVGCCGIDMGIHPFSMETISKKIAEFASEWIEIH